MGNLFGPSIAKTSSMSIALQFVIFMNILASTFSSKLVKAVEVDMAVEFLESAIQRKKQHYISVIDRPSSNTIEVEWFDLMRDCDDNTLDWFSLFLICKNRRFQLEQSSNITFCQHCQTLVGYKPIFTSAQRYYQWLSCIHRQLMPRVAGSGIYCVIGRCVDDMTCTGRDVTSRSKNTLVTKRRVA